MNYLILTNVILAECRPQQSNLRRLAQHDADYVETHMLPRRISFPGILPSDAHQMAPLLRIHCLFRWTEFVRRASLDFYDHQILAVACDQIRLGVAGGEPVIPRNDRVSLLAQEPMRQIFAAAARGLVSIPSPPPTGVSQRIQTAQNHDLITCNRHSITLPRTM